MSMKEHFDDGSLNEGTFQEAQELCKSLKDTCSKPGTEYSRIRQLVAKGALVLPEERFLLINYTACVNRSTGHVEQVQKRETFQYVPNADILKAYLEQPGMMDSILQCNADTSDNGMLASFRDGEYFTSSFKEDFNKTKERNWIRAKISRKYICI